MKIEKYDPSSVAEYLFTLSKEDRILWYISFENWISKYELAEEIGEENEN